MEQPIKKRNFRTLPDLAFGFVHKRSGNEISMKCRSRLLIKGIESLHHAMINAMVILIRHQGCQS